MVITQRIINKANSLSLSLSLSLDKFPKSKPNFLSRLTMTQSLKKQTYQKAFTIVELLVVIVVIGVLASISLVAYTGISKKATEASVVADLTNTVKQFKMFQVENSGYPATIDCAQSNSITNKCIKLSGGNTLGVFYVDNTSSSQIFCLTIKNGNNIKKNITHDGIISDGACTYPFPSIVATNSPAPTRYTISLSWNAISGASSYTLQRATDSGFTTNLTTLTAPAPTDTSAMSTGLTPSTTYYYRMNVTINGDTSNWSSLANANTAAFPAPTGLAVTSKTASSISLSWSAVSGATGYKLQRSSTSDFSSNTEISTAAGTTSYTSTNLIAGTTYYYRVNATDAGGSSGWSVTLTVATIQAYTVPGSYTWTVPAEIASVQLEASGAQGSTSGGVGGLGGKVTGNLSVTAGQQLAIHVSQFGMSDTTTITRSGTLLLSASSGSNGRDNGHYSNCDEEGCHGTPWWVPLYVNGSQGSGLAYAPVTSSSVIVGAQSGNGQVILSY